MYTSAYDVKGQSGYRKAPIPENAIKGVLQRLANRWSSTIADESCLTITADFSRHFLKVAEQGSSPFTGDRMMYVMLTLTYMIRDIAARSEDGSMLPFVLLPKGILFTVLHW